MDDNYKTPLITAAIQIAARNADLPAGAIFHSDRGQQLYLGRVRCGARAAADPPVGWPDSFHQVANLLNLEVDLLFFDTTSTYFELDEEDEAVPRDKNGNLTDDEEKAAGGTPAGFRVFGKSKDHRDDLPQVVIGMAVTCDGIPVRVWCWPGNTGDSALICQVKDDMRDWTLGRIVWVADRGFTSKENRRCLRSGNHHYTIGEKLRSGSAEAAAGGLLGTDTAAIKAEENLDGT